MKLYSVLKLSDGHEIYAKLPEDVNEGSPVLLVEDPLVQETHYDDEGNESTIMVRYCSATSENKIPIIKNHIVAMSAMSLGFLEYYKASVKVAELAAEAYENKLMAMACKIMQHMNTLELVGDNIISYTNLDTDTYH